MSQNPYSPTVSTTSGAPQHGQPLQKLRLPAIFLIVVTVLGLLNILIGFIMQVAQGQFQLDFSEPRNIGRLVGVILFPIFHFVFLYGAFLLLKGRQHSSARIAMILACIPICSPCLILGIPFAVWALVVMNQPDVKAAFID